MFSKSIKQQCPDICSYFEKVFRNPEKNIAPSIILYGTNSMLNYEFAKEIARLLNCTQDQSADCQCLNCKWIREDKHPAVKTYSNLDNKNDNAKTVISIEQIKQILEELVVASENKRVYIFCAAKERKDENGEIIKQYLPINRKILKVDAANALLKSIEEPPSNTYFIFITRDKEDILPTIISRSQSFYIHSIQNELPTLEDINELFKYYPIYDYRSAKEFIDNIKIFMNEHNLDTETMLNYAQNHLKSILEANIDNRTLTNRITSDIMKFEKAKKELNSNFKEQTIWENIIYNIYKD